MTFLDMMKETDAFTYTENGAGAYSSTGDYVLDAFGSLGGMMNSGASTIIDTFMKAFNKDRNLSMRMLFYFRDPRGGQGMRRLFRIILRYLATHETEYVSHNMENILFYGRGDDYLCLMDTPCESYMYQYIAYQLDQDFAAMDRNEECSLLAKWLPSENTSSSETVYYAKRMQKGLHMTPKQYRKMLSKLRKYINIVESKMSANKWDEIHYDAVPSKAAMKYTEAFMRHDQDGYVNYLTDVANGNAKINASVLFPVDIVGKILNPTHRLDKKDRILYECMWDALPNYFTKDETGLCVVDTSGSMSGMPIQVAVSLGMYCADKAKGPFAKHFITFSANPKLQEVYGNDIVDKVHNLQRADWDMNTNLEKVFKLILDTAIRNHCKPDEVPQKLYIISDMQFDAAITSYDYRYHTRNTSGTRYSFMSIMKQKFEANGYTFPAIVYWNVRASKCGMFQQRIGDTDFCNVSGYSASLFKSVIEGTEYVEEVNNEGNVVIKQKIDPIQIMMTTLMNERYDRVWGG